jgi:hypothetical protein
VLWDASTCFRSQSSSLKNISISMLRTAPGMRELNSFCREIRPEDVIETHFLNQVSYWLGKIFEFKESKGGDMIMHESNQKPVFKCKFGAFEAAIFLQECSKYCHPEELYQRWQELESSEDDLVKPD